MTRVAISLGHGFGNLFGQFIRDPGAVNKKTGISESEAVGSIGNALRAMLKYSPIEVVNIPRCSLMERIRIINSEHQQKAIDLAIEIHLNGVEDVRLNGTEVWYYPGSTVGNRAASYLLTALEDTLGFHGRGVRSNHTLAFLRDTKPAAILTEAAFISCDSVAIALDKGSLIPKIAWGHALGIWNFAKKKSLSKE